MGEQTESIQASTPDVAAERNLEVPPLTENPAFKNSTLYEKIQLQIREGLYPPIVFNTDVDRSLIQEDTPKDSPERASYKDASQQVVTRLESLGIPLNIVTGNDKPIIESYLLDGRLPKPPPDVLTTDTGSKRYFRQKNGSYMQDMDFESAMLKRFNRAEVFQKCLAFTQAVRESPEFANEVKNGDLILEFQPRDTEENVRRWTTMDPEKRMMEVAAWEKHLSDPQHIPEPEGVKFPQDYKISFSLFIHDETKITKLEEMLKTHVGASPGEIAAFFLQGADRARNNTSYHYYDADVAAIAKADSINALCKQLAVVAQEEAKQQNIPAELPQLISTFTGDSKNDEDAIKRAGDVGVLVGTSRNDLLTAINALEQIPTGSPIRKTYVEGNVRRIYVQPDQTKKGPLTMLELLDRFEPIIRDRKSLLTKILSPNAAWRQTTSK